MQVFDPSFNPIDISKGTKDDLAQSLYSIYEGLRNNIEPGIEDERSEILITTDSDDKSSKSSIIITKEDEQFNHNRVKTDDNVIDYHSKSSSLPVSSKKNQYLLYNAGESSTESRASAEYCENISAKLHHDHRNLFTLSSTSTGSIKHPNQSSGYITKTEQVPLVSYPPSEVLPLHGKQSECTSEATVNIKPHTQISIMHVSRTVNSTYSAEKDYDNITQVHGEWFTKSVNIVMEGCVTSDNDMHRWRKKSAIGTTSECTSNNNLVDAQCFIPSYNCIGKETCIHHELPVVDQDVLPECNLSLNPSHFQPLDSM